MLEKLAAIANYADQQGHYDVANEFTQLIKNAQLFDALKTLFDPSSSELDLNSGFWKRLTRGWQRGKFDRRLGLALAINAERTKLNKKIEHLSAPLKEFSAQVSAFYDKVRMGGENYGAMDFKEELSKLKSDAVKMKNLIGGRDLRKALDMRNKLNTQQISAVEKIKGIDPEHKDFLIKLLNGEVQSAPGKATPQAVPGQVTPADKTSPEQKEIRNWLKKLPIAVVDYAEGLTHPRSRGAAWTYYQRWGFNALAVKSYFEDHREKTEEGAEIFGKPFRKVFTDIEWVLNLEKAHGAKKEEAKEKAQAEEKAAEELASSTPAALPVSVPAAEKEKTPVPIAMPGAIPLVDKPKQPTEHQLDLGDSIKHDAIERAMEARKAARRAKKNPLPEETVPRPTEEAPKVSPASDLAISTATRTAREITRLGRVKKLAKLGNEMPPHAETLFPLDEDDFKQSEEAGMLAPEDHDVYMIPAERLETFDEDKHVNEEQLESFKGRGPEDDYYDDDESGPEDDDYSPSQERPEPNRLKGKEEQLDDVMNMLLLVEKSIDRLQAHPNPNPDYHFSDAERLRRLNKEKVKLLEMKNKLSGLPEGWADDNSI